MSLLPSVLFPALMCKQAAVGLPAIYWPPLMPLAYHGSMCPADAEYLRERR